MVSPADIIHNTYFILFRINKLQIFPTINFRYGFFLLLKNKDIDRFRFRKDPMKKISALLCLCLAALASCGSPKSPPPALADDHHEDKQERHHDRDDDDRRDDRHHDRDDDDDDDHWWDDL